MHKVGSVAILQPKHDLRILSFECLSSDCPAARLIERVCQFAGVAAGNELDVNAVTSDAGGTDKGQIALADAAFAAVTDLYCGLEAAIRNPSQRSGFQQPWKSQ